MEEPIRIEFTVVQGKRKFGLSMSLEDYNEMTLRVMANAIDRMIGYLETGIDAYGIMEKNSDLFKKLSE